MIGLSFSTAFLGFVLLALAMDRHHDQIIKGRPSSMARRLGTIGGWLCMLLSLALCIAAYGYSIGATWWLGVLTGVAAFLIFLLTYRPKTILYLAVTLPVITAVPLIPLF